jgi:nucleotide-binding universal stress UspA family protein
MIELRAILVASDFSEASGAALQQARSLAAVFGARIYLLHVFDPVRETWSGYMPGAELLKFIEQREANARMRLERLLSHDDVAKDRMTVATACGDPADEILRFAESHGVDLIVCGTHGRRGWDHAMMGSVAERIVRLARCPVLSVHVAPDSLGAAA